MARIRKHPIFYSIVISELIGFVLSLLILINSLLSNSSTNIYEWLLIGLLLGTFIVYPIILSIYNCYFFFDLKHYKLSRYFDLITFVLGFLYSHLVLLFYEIMFKCDWQVVLYNNEIHTPIWTKAYPTVLCLVLVGFLGYFLLAYIRLEKLPPLIIVLFVSMMYLGVFEAMLWIIQIMGKGYLLLCLFPLNCIIIAMKTLRFKINEWKNIEEGKKKTMKNKFLYYLNNQLMNSFHWPIAAFIFMLPLLGIIMCILILFNQQPDYFIKAYLNTSEWTLSQHVSPQNIYFDEHYLCTVAAGGHQEVVKPIRLGIRHDHQVIVNRQLCIANAFEQILEERVPRFHKYIRHFYDTYGFPIAKMIQSAYIADMIYLIMKPLEWLFLIIIYCSDVKPENRIAVQYTGGKVNVI